MVIDNFEKIRGHLRFDKPGDFYEVHVMFRVKDLRDEGDRNFYLSHDETQRLIKSYEIDSLERFDKKTPAMKDLAERNHARVYIIPSRKNRLVVNRVLAKKIIDYIDDPNLRYDHLIRSSVCGCHVSDYKWWVIDVDNDAMVDIRRWDGEEWYVEGQIKPIEHMDALIERMSELVNETKTRNGGEIYTVPTKNGCHILTPPFNKSKLAWLGDRVKTDGMTLLYYRED